MIFDFLFIMAYKMLAFIATAMPVADAETLDLMTEKITTFKDFMTDVDYLFPVETFFLFLRDILLIESVVFLYNLLRRLVTMISAGFVQAK